MYVQYHKQKQKFTVRWMMARIFTLAEICFNAFCFLVLSRLMYLTTTIQKTLSNLRQELRATYTITPYIWFTGSGLGHYLALAHSALTSFSLMSSQRLSCSIWRSRSLMSPIVTHIGRAAHTHFTHSGVAQITDPFFQQSSVTADSLPSDTHWPPHTSKPGSWYENVWKGELWR